MVQLYGPDAAGDIDFAAPVAGGRAMVRRGAVGRGVNGPAGIGPAGVETRWLALRSQPLVFGVKEFGVKRFRARQNGGVSESTPGTVTHFVNSSPTDSRDMEFANTMPAGQLRFTFTAGSFV